MDRPYRIVRFLLRPLLGTAWRWRIEGLEHIPADGPVLLAANHISFLDPPVLAYGADRCGRVVRFLAMAELFRIPVLGALLRSMGQIPVERSTAAAAASLDAARTELEAGACVGVFPEGGLSADLDPGPGRTGAVRLARSTGVPIVPVGIWGTHRVHRKGRFPRWRPGVTVVVAAGRPLAIGPDEHARLAADRLMSAICAQVNRARSLSGDSASGMARMRTCRGPAVEARHRHRAGE